jgi:hypothetical protein
LYLWEAPTLEDKVMDKETTLVVFRKWRDSGSVIALFPEIPSDISGFFCEAYEHVGQHGGADYYGVVQATRPASPEEAAPLAGELTRIGYKLKPIKRASRTTHERRRASDRAIREHV